MSQGLGSNPAPGAAPAGDGAPAEQAAQAEPAEPAEPDERARRRVPGWAVVGGLTLVVAAVPLAIALLALASPRWYPVMDLTETELRMRDVGTSHTPLVGMPGRIIGFGQQGNHPGPLSFYTLWPVYFLAGRTAFGLHLATIVSNVGAVAVALGIAYRRKGPMLALGVACALAVLLRGASVTLFIEVWNPYLTILWWIVFLLAVWSVLCADLALLPVAVFAGSYCMQTHISYAGMVPAVGLLAAGTVVILAVRRRADRAALVRLGAWTAGSVALGLLLWAPPVIEEVRHRPGNFEIIRDSFSHPADRSVGLGWDALHPLLSYLDPVGLLSVFRATDLEPYRGIWPLGLAVLLGWAATGLLAWRRRRAEPEPARLHLVVGVALAGGLISISRIQGPVRHYLLLWEWATAVPLAVATGWTVALVWRERRSRASATDTPPARRRIRPAVAALAAVTLVAAAQLGWQGAHEEVQAARETGVLAQLAPPTIAALRSGDVPGGGEDGRYLVRWGDDQEGFGVAGLGLFNELDRQGFTVRGIKFFAFAVVPYRTMDFADATATVNTVVGPDLIEKWRNTPGAVEVAYADPRSDEERERFDRLHDQVVQAMLDAGLEDRVASLDRNLYFTVYDPGLPPDIAEMARPLFDIGLPAAVFVARREAG